MEHAPFFLVLEHTVCFITSVLLFTDCFLSSSKIDFWVLRLNKQQNCVAYLSKGQNKMNGEVKGKHVAFTFLRYLTNGKHFIVRGSRPEPTKVKHSEIPLPFQCHC